MDSGDESNTSMNRGIPASIVLINSFDPNSTNVSEVAHKATCELVRHHLRTNSLQLLGVTFFGTQVTTSSTSYNVQCVTDIFPLTSITTKHYNDLKNTDISKIQQSKELILSDVLFHCSKIFSNCKRQLSSRIIFILSSFDVPPVKQDQLTTLELVKDLVDLNIEIRMINISQTQYEIDPFYNKFLKEANKSLNVKIPEPVWSHETILIQMLAESDRYLSVASLKFDIGNDVSIGVGVYKLLKGHTQTHSKSTNLDRDTSDILNSVVKTVKVNLEGADTNTNEEQREVPIIKSELLHCQEYAGERIEFTDSEYKLITNPFGPTLLKLLGFKSILVIRKEKWFLKNCYFLFPNERSIEGSTVAFKALHQACIETKVVAICVLSTRVNAKPLIVALSPCSYPLGLDISIGFDVIPLPFVENVRDLPAIEENEDTKITEDQKNIMSNIINNLKFDYQPSMFEDPKLQKLLNIIEAKALELANVEFNDTTLHGDEHFESIDNEQFYELFGPFNVVPAKRAMVAKETNGCKKLKTENIDENLLSDRVTNNEIGKYTVPELKQILKCKNASEALTGLKKQELVNLIYKYCS